MNRNQRNITKIVKNKAFGRGRRQNNRMTINQYRQMIRRGVNYQNRRSKQLGFGRVKVLTYGAETDLAFPRRRNRRKSKVSIPYVIPSKESNTVKTSFSFKNDVMTLTTPVSSVLFQDSNTFVIPLHPMFYYGRLFNMAVNFANFQVLKATVHVVPMVGTSAVGTLAVGSTRMCNPLNNQLPYYTLVNLPSEIYPCWMCSKYNVTDLDTSAKNMMMIDRRDIPNTVYISSYNITGTLTQTIQAFLEISFKLLRPMGTIYGLNYGTPVIFTVDANGYQCNSMFQSPYHGIVVSSTIPDVDVGEYVVSTGFIQPDTHYTTQTITHNSQELDYTIGTNIGTMRTVGYFEQ